ncbi:aconitase/3-isopropylmalate dehydratase large subunit family protein [Dongshaea marina]|uniref:aconitase/3-isopropylmalate dehydratase large subunit family protein n=1 Tax=Dongshaea marina TaxID=2047966 RepID=UPI001901BF82|nr:aconitase/3-isopropylmalate dehydratase large subunit family protein [Dongshaea marina]
MGQHIVEKILAHASGKSELIPGEIIECQVDCLMAHDSSGPRRWWPRLELLNARPWDPKKVVVITDHFVTPYDRESAQIVATAGAFARHYGTRLHDREGVCHIVLEEQGYIQPGMFAVGGDSHSPTAGAFGAFMCGYGDLDTTGVLVSGKTWERVPEVIRLTLNGRLQPGVCAKDIALYLARTLEISSDQVLEFQGAVVERLPMEERMVLTNMAPEIGAMTAIINPDEVTHHYMKAQGHDIDPSYLGWVSDSHAGYHQQMELDLSGLKPQIALPGDPKNADELTHHLGAHLDQCYIGGCTGAKLEDLKMAARVLEGQKVHPATRLLVCPASQKIMRQAEQLGLLRVLLASGAQILPPGCGACSGYGVGVLADEESCLSTTNRNFTGRMGSPSSRVWLASPYTVAASAIHAKISPWVIEQSEVSHG